MFVASSLHRLQENKDFIDLLKLNKVMLCNRTSSGTIFSESLEFKVDSVNRSDLGDICGYIYILMKYSCLSAPFSQKGI